MAALPGLAKGIGTIGRTGLTKGQPFPKGGPMRLPRPALHKGISGTGIIHAVPRAPGASPTNPGGTPQPQPGAPPQPGSDSSGSGSSPLDSTYFQNVAANQLRVNNQINGLNLQRSQDSTALQQALANLAYQQPRQQLALEQRANASGGLYSSAEGQNQGNLAHEFATRQGAAQQNYTNQLSRIASQIAALRGGEGLYESQQAEGAASRASNAAANNPALAGQLPSAASPAAARAPARSGAFRDVTRVGPRPLAQAIAKRPVVQVKPTLGKGTPRGVVRVKPVLGKGRRY